MLHVAVMTKCALPYEICQIVISFSRLNQQRTVRLSKSRKICNSAHYFSSQYFPRITVAQLYKCT